MGHSSCGLGVCSESPVVFWWPDPAKTAAVCGVLKRQVQHQPNLSPIMPPRPFPFPLRIGTDICYVPRIKNLFKPTSHGKSGGLFEGFLRRILTHPERVYFRHRFGTNEDILSSDIHPVAKFLAGRYAITAAVVLFHAHNEIDLQQKKRAAKLAITLPMNLAVSSK
jgi:phosphopantetheinyl transferase (holo-ACP synthase)